MNNFIIYEQPLNEIIRSCLRLEYLFNRIDKVYVLGISSNMHETLKYILDILTLLEMPSLKIRLIKKLHYYKIIFQKLLLNAAVDKKKLQQLITEIEELFNDFSQNDEIIKEILEQKFIKEIRSHFHLPGDCVIDSPLYNYWLHQSVLEQELQIDDYLDKLTQIRNIINIILKIARNSNDFITKTAIQGFYYENLQQSLSLQMIRIKLAKKYRIYPEISAGKHRISIRFMIPSLDSLATQSQYDVEFDISLSTN